ncbi:MAG: hypothetical protein WDM84_04635 [Bauldia sp.]
MTWSLAQAADGDEIVGNIDIPDRSMKIKLTIRRNIDKTLPLATSSRSFSKSRPPSRARAFAMCRGS